MSLTPYAWIYEGKVKCSHPDPEIAFQSVKVYVSCLRAHLVSPYDKLELVRSSSLCKWVFAVHTIVKLDKLECRAVIKFFVLDGLTPKRTHPKLTKVYEDSVPSILTIDKWAAEF